MFSLADQLLLAQSLVGATVRLISQNPLVPRHIGVVIRVMPYTPWTFNRIGPAVVAAEVQWRQGTTGVWMLDEFEVITPALGPTSV